nr:uncharacterized protein LOC107455705 isoform X4 [Parasteatoda tepidariorum]
MIQLGKLLAVFAMKFLAVLFLAGFGLAAASNVLSESFGVEVQFNGEPEVFHEVIYGDGNDDVQSLRKRLEELMEIVAAHRDSDKRPPKETLLEMKKIFEDMEKNDIELTSVEQMVKWALNYYIELPDSPRGLVAHEDPKTELSRILKKHFEEILEKVKDMIEDGKTYKEDLGEKLKEIAQKLKDMKVDISDHAKELLKKLKDKAKDYWKKIIDKITPGSEPFSADDAESLRKRLDELMEKLKEIQAKNENPPKEILLELKKIFEDMENKNIELTILEQIIKSTVEFYLKLENSHDLVAHEDPNTELGRILKKHFDEILEKVRDMIENGKAYKEDLGEKLKEIAQKLKDMKVDISDHAKELLNKLKDKAKDYWKKIIDKITPGSEPFAAEEEDYARNLRERFEEILEKIKDAIANRKTLGGNVVAKLKEIYQEMRKKSIPFGDKVKELLEEMKEKATGIWKRILDNIKLDKSSVEARGTGAENLRERLEELLTKLKESFRDRKLPGKGFISKLREIREEMRQNKVPLGGKLKEMIEKLKENANGVWRRILDRIGRNNSPSRSEEDQFARNLRTRLNEILEMVKDGFVTRTTIGGQYLYHLETVWNEMKEKSIPPGERAIQLIQELKKMTNGEWKELLYKLLPDEE